MAAIIFCNQDDFIADSVFHLLKNQLENLQLITAEELQLGCTWEHEITEKGIGHTILLLSNGTEINSDNIEVAWNRIRYFPMAHFRNPTDRFYAQNEMFSLYSSFLKGLKTLVNPFTHLDLTVTEENVCFTKNLCIQAGLPVSDFHFTSSPRWQSSQKMQAVSFPKNSIYQSSKKSQHLVWQDDPVTFVEPARLVSSIWIAGKGILGNDEFFDEKLLKKAAKVIHKFFAEILVVQSESGFKVKYINTFPRYAPDHVIEALANEIAEMPKK